MKTTNSKNLTTWSDRHPAAAAAVAGAFGALAGIILALVTRTT